MRSIGWTFRGENRLNWRRYDFLQILCSRFLIRLSMGVDRFSFSRLGPKEELLRTFLSSVLKNSGSGLLLFNGLFSAPKLGRSFVLVVGSCSRFVPFSGVWDRLLMSRIVISCRFTTERVGV